MCWLVWMREIIRLREAIKICVNIWVDWLHDVIGLCRIELKFSDVSLNLRPSNSKSWRKWEFGKLSDQMAQNLTEFLPHEPCQQRHKSILLHLRGHFVRQWRHLKNFLFLDFCTNCLRNFHRSTSLDALKAINLWETVLDSFELL